MGCNSHDAQGTPITECGFDKITIKLIHIARFYFTSYAAGESPDYELAMEIWKKDFGNRYAREITVSLLCVLSAMRQSRKSIFRYNSMTCKECRERVSECERLLFSTIKLRQAGEKSKAFVTAMMLCEGYDTNNLFKAIDRMDTFLQKFQTEEQKIYPKT